MIEHFMEEWGLKLVLIFVINFAILYRGKIDQDYPLFLLYNKSNIPGRPESVIGIQYRGKIYQIDLKI